jgi:hypothetical protein
MASNKEKKLVLDLEKLELKAKISGKPQVIIVGGGKAEIHDLPAYGKYEINVQNEKITNHYCIESRQW